MHFFFQAEDGIRDRSPSRGLGDVYKRQVTGHCPNPNCEETAAYSDECDLCGNVYSPEELENPKSTVSEATPVLKDTDHWWLDMWKVSDNLCEWIESKKKSWNKMILNETYNTVLPSFIFSNQHEATFKDFKNSLPEHKSRYAPGKNIAIQFFNKSDLEKARQVFSEHQIPTELQDGWAHRSITRDVSWGLPIPTDEDPSMAGKTLYVWPESLIAPISFTQVALKKKNLAPETYKDYWLSLIHI